MTLLNWTGQPIEKLVVRVRLPFAAGSVRSVAHGAVAFDAGQAGISCELPLKSADVLVIKP